MVMMENECLCFDIDSQLDAMLKIGQFVYYVTSPISEELFESALEDIRLQREKRHGSTEKSGEERPQTTKPIIVTNTEASTKQPEEVPATPSRFHQELLQLNQEYEASQDINSLEADPSQQVRYLQRQIQKTQPDLELTKQESSPSEADRNTNHLSVPHSGEKQASAVQVLGSKGSSGSAENYIKPMSNLQNAVRMSFMQHQIARTQSFANHSLVTQQQTEEERKGEPLQEDQSLGLGLGKRLSVKQGSTLANSRRERKYTAAEPDPNGNDSFYADWFQMPQNLSQVSQAQLKKQMSLVRANRRSTSNKNSLIEPIEETK